MNTTARLRTVIALVFLSIVSLTASSRAQSLADAAAKAEEQRAKDGQTKTDKTATKAYTNKDLPFVDSPSASSRAADTPGPDDPIDRTKFEKVYEASEAAVAAFTSGARGIAGQITKQQAQNAFETQASIAMKTATTKAEHWLAQKYYDAEFKLRIESQLRGKQVSAFKEALDMLREANKIYLRK